MKTLKLSSVWVYALATTLFFTSCEKEETSNQGPMEKKITCALQDETANNHIQLADKLFGAWSSGADISGKLDHYSDCYFPAALYDPNCCAPTSVILDPYPHIQVFEIWGPGDGNLVNGVCTAAKQQALFDRAIQFANDSVNLPCTAGMGGQLFLTGFTFSHSIILNGSGATGVVVEAHYAPVCYSFGP